MTKHVSSVLLDIETMYLNIHFKTYCFLKCLKLLKKVVLILFLLIHINMVDRVKVRVRHLEGRSKFPSVFA